MTHRRAKPTLDSRRIVIGLTYVRASIANPANPRPSVRVKFLIDSGAMYSVVPAPVLRRLGIKPGKTKTFILADGSEIKRPLGEARFRLNGEEGTSPVIFGEKGDSILLGSISLEVMGFILDPFKRELRPLPMMLAAHRPGCDYSPRVSGPTEERPPSCLGPVRPPSL